MRINDVILRTVVKVVILIILTLGVYLFFSGHHAPGGGFIGGLVLASGIILLFVTYDIETIQRKMPFDFKKVAALGVFIAAGTGLGAIYFDLPFLSHTDGHFKFPFIGDKHLTTVTLFEAGVALTVIGTLVTMILSISEDE
ncbi:Na(+)/H(+) antiporter subunit B [Ureibacillus sp. FSL K6-8385]|uniref:Na(+)/H(+) antiporter subunit B n=1 Tax=Ureibacillus terrenus TaxID=118246 RepID=A0A540UZ67_9BACL|nr:Na(+)/H(+) antiporter subunit B [Ureibacillus terrenus]MED3662120.1 Na(+)/H(+) antiporter subunit B [Ureibacillus terrenus]MED3764466.1 Na(+)/H(+) antiporter subunit B [Ureibacillus terrenus]TQE89767.1 Na(+)/H(+) antiporter subunit B [Ureibacillus terrenus]